MGKVLFYVCFHLGNLEANSGSGCCYEFPLLQAYLPEIWPRTYLSAARKKWVAGNEVFSRGIRKAYYEFEDGYL